MARARKSHASDEETTKTRGGMIPAYSAHVAGHKYVVYASLKKEADPYSRALVLKFLGTYAAKHMILGLIGKDEYEITEAGWCDRDDLLTTSSGIKIHVGPYLQEIMNHEFTTEEAEWRDPWMLNSIGQFKYGRHEGATNNDLPVHSPVRQRADDAEPEAADEPRAKADRRTAAPKPTREPRPDTSDHVSANDIAKRLGVEGREVRGVLRALKLDKPAHGWSWPKKDAVDMEAKIKQGLKDAKKGKKK